jgi:predicted amidophosphoribosyltransferase
MTPQRRQYEKRKFNNLCPRCGKPLDRDGFYCKECLDARNKYNRENRKFFNEVGLCPVCGKVKLFEGEKACPECKAKNATYKSEQYWKDPDKLRKRQSDYGKKQYLERIEKGICVRCGKRKPVAGYRTCGVCREKDRQAKRLRYKPKNPNRWKEGFCYRCGKPIEDKKYKLCSACVEQNRQNSQFVDRTNHYWRQLDKAIYVKG